MARKISFFSQKNSRRAGQSASWIFFSSTHINVVKTTFFPRIVKEGREIRILIRLSSKVISLWQREDSQQKIKEGRGIRILVFFYSPPFPSPDISIWQGELPAKYQEGYGGPHRGPLSSPPRHIQKESVCWFRIGTRIWNIFFARIRIRDPEIWSTIRSQLKAKE